MLASKYLPHLIGLNVLFNMAVRIRAGANAPRPRTYYPAMLAAFLWANFASCCSLHVAVRGGLPARAHVHAPWLLYAGRALRQLRRYHAVGRPVDVLSAADLTKAPLPALAGMLAGLVLLFTRRNVRGFVWLRVFLVFLLLGYSVVAAKFQRYALAAHHRARHARRRGTRRGGPSGSGAGVAWHDPCALSHTALAACGASRLLGPAAEWRRTSRRIRTGIGAGQAAPATVYPEEAYDYGVREAVGRSRSCRARCDHRSDARWSSSITWRRHRATICEVRSLSQHGLLSRGTLDSGAGQPRVFRECTS